MLRTLTCRLAPRLSATTSITQLTVRRSIAVSAFRLASEDAIGNETSFNAGGSQQSSSDRGSRAASQAPSSMPGSGNREVGTVKWFDASKGFGFVVRESGEDLFVHFSGIRGTGYRTLEEGQRVEFIIANGHKGPVAQDVTLKA